MKENVSGCFFSAHSVHEMIENVRRLKLIMNAPFIRTLTCHDS